MIIIHMWTLSTWKNVQHVCTTCKMKGQKMSNTANRKQHTIYLTSYVTLYSLDKLNNLLLSRNISRNTTASILKYLHVVMLLMLRCGLPVCGSSVDVTRDLGRRRITWANIVCCHLFCWLSNPRLSDHVNKIKPKQLILKRK